ETAPRAAANKGEHVRTPREFLLQSKIAQACFSRQHPLHHLGVRSRGKVGAPERNMGGDVFAGRRNLQPRCVFVQRLEKFLQPARLIAMRERPRPHSELFHIVAKGSRAAGTHLGGLLEIGDGFLDPAEWDEVTQLLQAREKPDGLAAILGNVHAVQLFWFEARSEKWQIVHKRVTDIGRSQRRWQLRLPDALREPCSRGPLSKMLFQVIRQARELLFLICLRDRNENGLVESSADQFNLSGSNHAAQALEVFGMALLNPQE